MPSFELEFEVFCSCGQGLCTQSRTDSSPGRGMPYVTIEPCEECLEKARDEGYSDGYDQAEEDCSD